MDIPMGSGEEKVYLGINKGDKFQTYKEAESAINAGAQQNFVQFYKREARTINAGTRKTTRYLNPALMFYQVEWACVHGGRPFKSQGKGIRPSKTLRYREPCPAQIRIRVSPSGNDFEVINVHDYHNHPVCKSLFDKLPQQRRLPAKIRNSTKRLLDSDELNGKSNKKINLKDLTNVKSGNKAQSDNNIEAACEKINSILGGECHVLVDDHNLFNGLMFCTGAMKLVMDAYPEFLFIDGSCKLSNICATVYLVMAVNGNGESVLVAVGILITEDVESIVWLLENFKQENPKWIQTKTVTINRDLLQNNAVQECFPSARLQVCVFNALKNLQTEITAIFKITASERQTIIEYIQKLLYCTNDTEFSTMVGVMEKEIPTQVFQYLETNWCSIKELINPSAKFLDAANNTLDVINGKLKRGINKYNSIGEFLDRLIIVLKFLQNQQDSELAKLVNKRSWIHTPYKTDSFEYKYQTILTPYAFKEMTRQFNFESIKVLAKNEGYVCSESWTVSYCVIVSECTCDFRVSMCLPCKHIFALRRYLNEELFAEDLIPERWRMKYLLENNSLVTNNYPRDFDEPTVNEFDWGREKTLNQQQKYKTLLDKCKTAASLSATANDSDYTKVANLFDKIVEMLQRDSYDFSFTCSYSDKNGNDYGTASEQVGTHIDETLVRSEEEVRAREDEDYGNLTTGSSGNIEVYRNNSSVCVEITPNDWNSLQQSNSVTYCNEIEDLDCGKTVTIEHDLAEEFDYEEIEEIKFAPPNR